VRLGLLTIVPIASLITPPREIDECGDERQFGFQEMPFGLGAPLAYFFETLKPHRFTNECDQD